MPITLIACVDKNMGIGCGEDLLAHLPNDLRHFRENTEGKLCVFGRKTFESLPKKPLPNRKNYVLTKQEDFKWKNTIVLHEIEPVLDLAENYEVMICGGSEIYNTFLPYADKLIVTFIDEAFEEATVFFPDISSEEWKEDWVEEHQSDETNPHDHAFVTYKRIE